MRTAARRQSRSTTRWVVFTVLFTGFLALTFTTGCTEKEEPAPASKTATTKAVLLPIEGMTCSSCVARVKRKLLALDGVAEVSVDLVKRQARIQFDSEKLSKDQLAGAVDGLGYRAGVPKEIE